MAKILKDIHGRDLPKTGTTVPIPLGPLKGLKVTILGPGKRFERAIETLWVYFEGEERPLLPRDGVELPVRYFTGLSPYWQQLQGRAL